MTASIDPNRCLNCGKSLSPVWQKCHHCNTSFSLELAAARVGAGAKVEPKVLAELKVAENAPVLVRQYGGTSQKAASAAYAADSQILASQGYRVVSQSWDQGTRGVAGVVTLGLLSPKQGSLTVTYERAEARPAETKSPEAEPAPGSKADELRKLAGLRNDGILTDEEFAAEKAKLLARND